LLLVSLTSANLGAPATIILDQPFTSIKSCVCEKLAAMDVPTTKPFVLTTSVLKYSSTAIASSLSFSFIASAILPRACVGAI
jgi:hypothetical protein